MLGLQTDKTVLNLRSIIQHFTNAEIDQTLIAQNRTLFIEDFDTDRIGSIKNSTEEWIIIQIVIGG